MSELSKQALKVENNQSFPNNNAGLITPSALRTFNEDMIDSMVDEISYNVDSGSWNQKIDNLSSITGSIPLSGSYATTGSNTFTGTQTIIDTTGLQIKSDVSETDFITIKSGTNILGLGRIDGVQVYNFGKSYLRLADAGTTEAASLTGLYTSYQDGKVSIGVSAVDSGLSTATQLQVYKNRINANVDTLVLSGSLTASLQEGYVWVGDGSGKTIATSTGSFGSVLPSGVVSGSSQVILQDTTGDLSGSRIDGAVALATNSTYAQNTITTGKNLHSSTIAKGTPLFFTGSGNSGNMVGVYPADAGNPDRMPAGGIAGEELAVGAEGIVLLDGYIGGVDTSLFASGDMVYVAVGGGYTNVVPTGSAQIQFLGNVEKSAVNGSGVIQMNGEVRGLPNIQQGYAWVGDSNGVPQAVSTGSFIGASFPYIGNAEITGSLLVSSSASSSIIVPNTFGVEGFVVDGNLRVQNGTLNVNQAINAGGIYLQTIGRNSNDPINVDNGLNIRPGAPGIAATDVSISGSLIVSQSISAELQQGYVWVGDSNNRTTQVSTGSFGGGGSTFPYTGDAEITGSLGVSNTVTSQIFLNPQTLTGTQTVPTGYNGMLTGPVSNAGTIVIEGGANLVII